MCERLGTLLIDRERKLAVFTLYPYTKPFPDVAWAGLDRKTWEREGGGGG